MLKALQPALRKPVGEFLIGHIQKTKSITLSIPHFVSAIYKAATEDVPALKSAILACKDSFNDKDVLEITKNVNSVITSKPRERRNTGPAQTLQQRIDAQKRLLREKERRSLRKPVPEPHPSPRRKLVPSRPTSPEKSRPHKEILSVPASPKGRPARSPLRITPKPVPTKTKIAAARKNAEKTPPAAIPAVTHAGTSARLKKGLAAIERKDRFDPPDYIKPISAFTSPRTSIPAAADSTSLLEMIRQNSIAELTKKMAVPAATSRLDTSEEREIAKCTFRPRTNSRGSMYNRVKSRILSADRTILDNYGEEEDKKPRKQLFRRVTSPDGDLMFRKKSIGSLTSGTSAGVYDTKTARGLQQLLTHGYSFAYEERKFLRSDRSLARDSEEQPNEALVRSRIINRSKGISEV